MFVLGFTGTQYGMTPAQHEALRHLLLYALAPTLAAGTGVEAHHGDCVGADKEFHLICKGRGWRVVGHPPVNNSKRAFCDFDEERPPLPYLERNKNIVRVCSLLIACPAQITEVRRSGTWSTVRFAQRTGVPYRIVGPDGEAARGRPVAI